MTPELWTPVLVVAIPAVMGMVGSLLSLYVSSRNNVRLREIHVLINSRLEALLTLTASSARAEGVIEGSKPLPERTLLP